MSSASASEVLRANVRLWRLIQADELPVRYWLIGGVVPLLFRSLVYVLLGRLVYGAAGADWAYLGAVVLAITGETVSAVSDIPLIDVWMRTYGAVTRARASVVAQYSARSLVVTVRALAEAAAVAVVVGLLTMDAARVGAVLAHLWLLLPAVASAVAFGLAIISVSLSNDSQNLVHNTANAVLVLTSGALLAPGVAPWVHAVGGVLPLQHALAALRAALDGRPWAAELGLEVLVAAGWALVAAVAYRLVDHRTRATGRGALGS